MNPELWIQRELEQRGGGGGLELGAVLLPAGLLLLRSHPAREGGGEGLQRSPAGGGGAGGGVGRVEPGLQDGLNLIINNKLINNKYKLNLKCLSVTWLKTSGETSAAHLLFLLPVVQCGRGILGVGWGVLGSGRGVGDGGRGVSGYGRGVLGHRDSILVSSVLSEQPEAQSFFATVLVTDAVRVGGANLISFAGLLQRHHLLKPRLKSCWRCSGRWGGVGGGWGLQALKLAQVLDLHGLGGLTAGGAVGCRSARPNQPFTGWPAVGERLQHLPPSLGVWHGLHGSSCWGDEPVAQLLLLFFFRRDDKLWFVNLFNGEGGATAAGGPLSADGGVVLEKPRLQVPELTPGLQEVHRGQDGTGSLKQKQEVTVSSDHHYKCVWWNIFWSHMSHLTLLLWHQPILRLLAGLVANRSAGYWSSSQQPVTQSAGLHLLQRQSHKWSVISQYKYTDGVLQADTSTAVRY